MEPGFVYLMEDEGDEGDLPYHAIKIGKSFSPDRREKDFSVYRTRVRLIHKITTNDMGWLEAKFHRRYASRRKKSEWFDLKAKDLDELFQLAIVDRVPDDDFSLYAEDRGELDGPLPGLEEPVVEPFRASLVSSGWRLSEQVVQDLFSRYWRVTGRCRKNVLCTVALSRATAWRRAYQRAAVVGMAEAAVERF